MTTPTEATNLREELGTLIGELVGHVEGGHTTDSTQGCLYGSQTLDAILNLFTSERTTVLPDGFSGQDIANCTNELDQGHMRGFNECLEYIKKLQGEK